MNSFEINKIVGAVLVTALAIKTFDVVVDHFAHPEPLEEKAFAVAVPEDGVPRATTELTEAAEIKPVAPLLASASVENGEQVFRKCAICHTLDKGGANKRGPNLYGVVGGPKAHIPGFNYSQAMVEAGGTWDYEALNKYLEKPRDYIPGNQMAFAGLKSVEDRAAVIALLRSKSDNPPPLPE
ncbi:MAG: cytochrome c family protein [Alphaproteobacteria bacterium]